MPDTLSHRPGRGGATVNERGDQGTIGFWPEEYDKASPGSWVGRLRNSFGEAVRISQRHHQRNELMRLAKIKNEPPQLPEPDVRQKLARSEQKRLDELERHAAAIEDEAFLQKARLAPFDYEAGGIVDAMRRQELRTILRTMPDGAKRLEAMHQLPFRKAALELPGEVSGLPPSTWTQLREDALAATYPEVISGHAEATEAVARVRQSLKTARRAVDAELVASGAEIVEQPAPAPAKDWA